MPESDDTVALRDMTVVVCIDAVADVDAVTSVAVGDVAAVAVSFNAVADFLLLVMLLLLQISQLWRHSNW